MNKKLLTIIGIASLFVGAVSVSAALTRNDVNPPTSYVATSSVTYLVTGQYATSTATAVSDVDLSYLFVNYTASTSASTIGIRYQFSFDGIDWYDYVIPGSPTSATLTLPLATTTTFTYNNGFVGNNTNASTTYIAMKIPEIPANYLREIFIDTNANGAYFARVENIRKGYNSVNSR